MPSRADAVAALDAALEQAGDLYTETMVAADKNLRMRCTAHAKTALEDGVPRETIEAMLQALEDRLI